MNDETSNSSQDNSLLKKIGKVFSPNPSNSDEVADMLRSAENESIIDASALQIMEGALKVSDLQAREIMIPRSQMNVIEEDFSLEQILELVIQSQHSRFPGGRRICRRCNGYLAGQRAVAAGAFRQRILRPEKHCCARLLLFPRASASMSCCRNSARIATIWRWWWMSTAVYPDC